MSGGVEVGRGGSFTLVEELRLNSEAAALASDAEF